MRVLELGNYIAAPTAGRMLADFGAEVIKVERPVTGDELRNWRLYSGDTSMLYRTINRNKKSIVIDLKTQRGREIVARPRPALRRAARELPPRHPGEVGARTRGAGPSEPGPGDHPDLRFRPDRTDVRRPGFAAVAEAFGGLRELVGDPDRPPVRTGVSIGDSIAGIYAAFGTVMALFQRERVNVPLPQRIIDVALNESVLSVMESLVPDYLAYGVTRERVGGRMEGIAPSNAYPCADGTNIIVAGNGDAIFQRYMQIIGRPDFATDPDLQTNAGRWRRREELDAAIGEWTIQYNRDDALKLLDEAGVPSGPIYTAADICADDQYRARNMIQHFDVDTGEAERQTVGFPGIVPVIGPASLPIRSVGPDLGEHTREVLSSLLDLSDDEIGALT